MAVTHFAYIFDIFSFATSFETFLDQADNLSKDLSQRRDSLEGFIERFAQPCASLDKLNAVNINGPGTWLRVERALRLLQWSDEDIHLVVHGRSFEEMLTEKPYYLNLYRKMKIAFYGGWLDINDVNYLLTQLKANRKDFLNLSSQQTLAAKTAYSLSGAYKTAVNMLQNAKNINKGLYLGLEM